MVRLYDNILSTPFRRSVEQTHFQRTRPHTQGLIEEARRQAWQALLLGHFDMALRYAEALERLAHGLAAKEDEAFALAIHAILACLMDHDPVRGKVLAQQAQALAYMPKAQDKLALTWAAALAALRTGDAETSRQHLAAALRDAVPINPRLGIAHLVMHAMLYAQCGPSTEAIQFLALAWTCSLPDGGWLQASPYCKQIAHELQKTVGMDLYRKLWFVGERLSLHGTLAQLIEQSAR